MNYYRYLLGIMLIMLFLILLSCSTGDEETEPDPYSKVVTSIIPSLSRIPPNSISHITARIEYYNGDPAGGGIPVTFTTSHGLWVTGISDSLGTAPDTSTHTNRYGEAKALLKHPSNIETATVEVQVSTGDDIGKAHLHFVTDADTSAPGTPTSITITSISSSEICVYASGGNDMSTIKFLVRDAKGKSVADSTKVYFFRESGPGMGTDRYGNYVAPSDTVFPAAAYTVNGSVQCNIQAGTKSGVVRLRAKVDEVYTGSNLVQTNAISVVIRSGSPDDAHFSLCPKLININGLVECCIENEITASVFDKYSNQVPVGTAVYYNVNVGGIGGSCFTDNTGHAKESMWSAAPLPLPGDNYTVIGYDLYSDAIHIFKSMATIVGHTYDGDANEILDTCYVMYSGHSELLIYAYSEDHSELLDNFVGRNGRIDFLIIVRDIENGNPLMNGTTMTTAILFMPPPAAEGEEVQEPPILIGDTNITLGDVISPAYTTFYVSMLGVDSTIPTALQVDVKSPNGNVYGGIGNGLKADKLIKTSNGEMSSSTSENKY